MGNKCNISVIQTDEHITIENVAAKSNHRNKNVNQIVMVIWDNG